MTPLALPKCVAGQPGGTVFIDQAVHTAVPSRIAELTFRTPQPLLETGDTAPSVDQTIGSLRIKTVLIADALDALTHCAADTAANTVRINQASDTSLGFKIAEQPLRGAETIFTGPTFAATFCLRVAGQGRTIAVLFTT